jgi:hypothetical protein
MLVSFAAPPDWSWVGFRLLSYLGACDQAAQLGEESEVAILSPEAPVKKTVRLLGRLSELDPIRCGLAQAWPGRAITAEELVTLARERLAERAETLQKLVESQGPWAFRETELIPAEKDSLFEGFGRLSLGG